MSISFDELTLQRFDPDALLHVINTTTMEQRLLGGGVLNVHLQRLVMGDLVINTGNYSFPVLARGGFPHDQQAHIGLVTGAIDDVRVNHCVLPLNQLQLYAPGSELHYTTGSSSEWCILVVPLERLQTAAIAQQGVELEWPREGVRYVDFPPDVGKCLRRELRGLLQLGRSFAGMSDGRVTESLSSEGLIQLLTRAITGQSCSSRPRTTLTRGRRRALVSLESCIDRWKRNPAAGLNLAQAEGISERLLELATREAYDVTPHRWLKLARLNAAYQDLLHGSCDSVTGASQQWGFNHTGRFAIEYRALFGESPRETLRRNNNPV